MNDTQLIRDVNNRFGGAVGLEASIAKLEHHLCCPFGVDAVFVVGSGHAHPRAHALARRAAAASGGCVRSTSWGEKDVGDEVNAGERGW